MKINKKSISFKPYVSFRNINASPFSLSYPVPFNYTDFLVLRIVRIGY